MSFPDGSFDPVTAFCSALHVPREDQDSLMHEPDGAATFHWVLGDPAGAAALLFREW